LRLYLDSSALVKLVRRESESVALRHFLGRFPDDGRATSSLARVEVVRSVAFAGRRALSQANRLLGRLIYIDLDRAVLDDAATLLPATPLRSLDAIHIASARVLGTDLRAIVTYDQRMRDAATALGLAVEAPA
jgi:predicted nucleic acid-binding protein